MSHAPIFSEPGARLSESPHRAYSLLKYSGREHFAYECKHCERDRRNTAAR